MFPLPVLLTGMIVSAVVGLLAIWMVKVLINSDRFRYFGYYTAVLGVVVIAVALYERISGTTLYQIFS